MSLSEPVTVFVCTTCRHADDATEAQPRAGARLAATLAPSEGVEVREVECLANCKRGPSVAMTRAGGWSYVFGGLAPTDGAAVLEGAQLLSRSADGLMPWRGRPEPLKRGLIARIPPIPGASA
ncbi:MAG: metal-binding protein [Rubritepida sp.]|nr:metal-binding protein [Rubritepida sp.]